MGSILSSLDKQTLSNPEAAPGHLASKMMTADFFLLAAELIAQAQACTFKETLQHVASGVLLIIALGCLSGTLMSAPYRLGHVVDHSKETKVPVGLWLKGTALCRWQTGSHTTPVFFASMRQQPSLLIVNCRPPTKRDCRCVTQAGARWLVCSLTALQGDSLIVFAVQQAHEYALLEGLHRLAVVLMRVGTGVRAWAKT
jgi:hypothetical protein